MHMIYKNQNYHDNFQNWTGKLFEYKKYNCPNANSIIISDENLSGIGIPHGLQSIFNEMRNLNAHDDLHYGLPICQALYYFSQQYQKVGNVRIIFTIRKQPEWIASYYAQRSAFLFYPSQEKFEKLVDNILEIYPHLLDWSTWINNLQTAVGKENICVLPLEEMKSEEYWQKLTAIIQSDDTKIDTEQFTNFIKWNKRGINGSAWQIRPFHKNFLKKRIKTWRNTNKHSYINFLLYSLLFPVSSIFDPILYRLLNIQRTSEIYLSHYLMSKVHYYLNQQNDRLNTLTYPDIKKLGY